METREKADVHRHRQRYENWKQEVQEQGSIEGATRANSEVILHHVADMEAGRNIARGTAKGGRGFARLNNIRQRLIWLAKEWQRRGVKDITKLTEKQATDLFNDMRKGVLKTRTGGSYLSTGDYANVLKNFWHCSS